MYHAPSVATADEQSLFNSETCAVHSVSPSSRLRSVAHDLPCSDVSLGIPLHDETAVTRAAAVSRIDAPLVINGTSTSTYDAMGSLQSDRHGKAKSLTDTESTMPTMEARSSLSESALPPPPPLYPPGNLYLPPPPPSTDAVVQASTTVAQRHAVINGYDQELDHLRDARDAMMGDRFRLRSKRNELRSIRNEASAKDGSIFNMLRQWLRRHKIPQQIEDRFDEASNLRDQLGQLEAEYDEAEMKYDEIEWNYTRKESKIVDLLFDTERVPVDAPHQKIDLLQAATLTRFAVGNSTILRGDAPLERLSHWNFFRTPEGSEICRCEPLLTLPRSSTVQSNSSTAKSANDVNTDTISGAQFEWEEKLRRIDKWLLDILLASPLQIARLKAMEHMNDLDGVSWLKRVEENWSLQHDLPVFHSGDSTVSHVATSHHFSTVPVESISSENLVVQEGNVSPPPQENATPDTPKTTCTPLRNALEASPKIYIAQPFSKHLDYLAAIISVSTNQSASHWTSSSGGNDTDTTSDRSSDLDACTRRAAQISSLIRRQHIVRSDSCLGCEPDTQSAPATPTQQVHTEKDLVTPEVMDLSSEDHNVWVAPLSLDTLEQERKAAAELKGQNQTSTDPLALIS